ncbi:MAG: hypothetical protein H6569_03720 [Lewinellaceae bacterium]|nr:hypothetical protein [Lewinellaceae bacterium]
MKQYTLFLALALLPFAALSQSCYNAQFLNLNAPCLAIYQPVCSCDSTTFVNDCEALHYHGITAFVPGECQQVTGPCNATAALAARFHFAAKARAFHRQVHGLGDSTTIAIPDTLYQTALKSLISVYQLTNNPARDELFTYMHYFAGPLNFSPISIYLAVDSSETWGKNLQNGILPSGDPIVDDLMNTHLLKARLFFNSSGKRWLIVDSPFPLNTFALSKAFSGAAGFYLAEPRTIAGDGDRTEIQSWDDPMVIDFSYGWGDCPAGCIFRHYWQFSIDTACQATFIQSWGDPLPAVATTEASTVQHFAVLGAPGSSTIRLQVELAEAMPFTVRIWNALGQLHQQYRFEAAEIDERLDWEGAVSGVYFFELAAGNRRAVRKMIH